MRTNKIEMMKSGLIMLCLLIVLSSQVNAQSTDLYIVINEATWCPYCKANGQRIHQLIDEYTEGKQIVVLSNDVTDGETKKKTEPQLEEMGVLYYMKNHKEAAVIFVFDAKTKKIAEKFSIKTDNKKVIAYLNKAMESTVN
ncbi:thioredoxin domain-containing protein [Reichenbachiella agarivorans]|uniref:Thioredoxin domain-containing protein n=1 Tax=Reichenbachiella agarivorans TaxID=2979464 RepID=A0ABY6CQ03_9BACT|nr:thioredoxin domain-containing protein [Reichenbachiella agarivorans]UXP32598.1 thioredoxin domain-containing protein [Reichenbachiella agarivorans]